MLGTWLKNKYENIGEKTALTPASNHLYDKGEGLLLNDGERESFHSTVAKALYVSTCSWPDIFPTVSVLSSRVHNPTTSNKGKLVQILQYLNRTRKLHLALRYNGLSLARWHIDSSFVCHPDSRSQSEGVLMMHPGGGGIAFGSTKQKSNTWSSTMAELVAVDDFCPRFSGLGISWMHRVFQLKANFSKIMRAQFLCARKGERSCLREPVQ